MLLLLAALWFASGTPEVSTYKPTPVGDPAEWVTPDDYPKSELMADVQGVTGFELFVDATGKVTDCIVTWQSGNEGLDAVACALLRDRAHFVPGHDADGQAIVSTYRSSVRWQIPNDPHPTRSPEVGANVSSVAGGCEIPTRPPVAAIAVGSTGLPSSTKSHSAPVKPPKVWSYRKTSSSKLVLRCSDQNDEDLSKPPPPN